MFDLEVNDEALDLHYEWAVPLDVCVVETGVGECEI